MTLPYSTIEDLGFPNSGSEEVMLADGAFHPVNMFSGQLLFDGEIRRIEIDAAETPPLLGMGLLYGYHIHIENLDGGKVVLEKIL